MEEVINVTKSSMPMIDEYIAEIRELWDTHWLTNMGVKHNKFQEALIKYLQTDNLELMVNGHMALEMTLQAFELKGEVITTPFTFVSTTHAIVRNGLTPVFCDIDPNSFTIDASKIEELITEKTCAILPVHVYGNICEIEKIDEIAKRYGLKVIYDAAHCFGEMYKEIGIANFGDASCFSFHATKVFNSIEGGAVSFRDDRIGKKIYDLKNFGIHGPEEVSAVGANAKMNEFCAAMGLCNLKHIDEQINGRKKIVEKYTSLLSGIDGIQLNCKQKDVTSNYAYYPIIIDDNILGTSRDELFEKLLENNIIARKYFYPTVNSLSCYKGRFDEQKTPIALKISQGVLTLPLYSELEMEVVERICDIIKACIK